MHYLDKLFFTNEECNITRNKINNIFLEKTIDNLEVNNISHLELAKNYTKARKKSNWQNIYDLISIKLEEISFIKDKLINKAIKDGIKNPKVISIQCRMLDINDKRSYPLHQDWPGIELDSLMIYWIPLHKVGFGEGCLKICDSYQKKKLNHVIAKNGYPILSEQSCKFLNNKALEIPMEEGDCLGFDGFTVHGSAAKFKGITRFALIYRIA